MNAVWTRIGEREPTPSELNEIFRVQDARDCTLATMMTETERERYEAERSGDLPRLRSELAELKLADEEALTLLRLQGYEQEARTSGASPDDPELAELAESRTKALRDLLGADRYAAYERLQDSTYVTLRDLGKQHGVNAESVVQAYELVRNRAGEATPESASFDAQLKTLLGDDAFNEWVQLGEAEKAVMANAASLRNPVVSDAFGETPKGPR